MTKTTNDMFYDLRAKGWWFNSEIADDTYVNDEGRAFVFITDENEDTDVVIGFPTPTDVNGTLYIARRDDEEMRNVPVFGEDIMRAPLAAIRAALEENGFGDMAFIATREGFHLFWSFEDSRHLIEAAQDDEAGMVKSSVLAKIAEMFDAGDDDHIKVDGADLLTIAQALTIIAGKLGDRRVGSMMETMVAKHIDAIETMREVA